MDVFWVFLGGGVGAVMRWMLSDLVTARVGHPFPWGTLTVNLLGCLAIGLLAGWLADKPQIGPMPRFLLATGLLGGFTTFSTFGLDTWLLIEDGRAHWAAIYGLASLAGGTAGVAIGLTTARSLG